ncbi:Fe-S oxidoreductase [Crateriforma conspicua]|uniref:Fe-S oxidoreductase n=1 Tax=Crateriforma conspicua TaxID=2527996 RepID=UPI00118B9EA4|nr:Fe-S oxidoreductase [Crateriforma conspicua]QDV63807.1 hypothetical protein Mal65_29540 [Crateriforma conspicua]
MHRKETIGPLIQRNPLSADSAYQAFWEREAAGCGKSADVLTIMLAVSACPIRCTMCDLWRNTLVTKTPPGAVPHQIRRAIEQLHGDAPKSSRGGSENRPRWIKLYNSGCFFDHSSIPPDDYESIGRLVSGFDRVIVENHPRFDQGRLQNFARHIDGQLEIAVGLETVQPRWLNRMKKRMTRDTFDDYAMRLRSNDVDLRVFLIWGVPGASHVEASRWTIMSALHASRMGARHISIVPARRGNGWGEFKQPIPDSNPMDLALLQQQLIRKIGHQTVVTVDLWDMDRDQPADVREALEQIGELNQHQDIAMYQKP